MKKITLTIGALVSGFVLGTTGIALAQPPNPETCTGLTGNAYTDCRISELDNRLRNLEPSSSPSQTPSSTPSATPSQTPSTPSATPSATPSQTPSSTPSATQPIDDSQRLKSESSGKYLAFNSLGQAIISATPAPLWLDVSGSYSRIRTTGNKCLTPGGTAAGSRPVLATCDATQGQQWTTPPANFNTVKPRSASGLSLDINGGSTAEGASVIVWTTTGAANQGWKIENSPTNTASPSATPSASATPSSTPSSTATPTGDRAPVGDLAGWKQIFAENFDGTTRPAVWSPYSDTLCCGDKYDDSKVKYENSQMVIPVTNVNGTMNGTAGRFGPSDKKGLRTAFRFKVDQKMTGVGMANMLWMDSEKWEEGEVDFPEFQFDETIGGFVHQVDSRTDCGDGFCDNVWSYDSGKQAWGDWHTAVTEWIPGQYLRFYLDGQLVGTVTGADKVPTTNHSWRFQIGDNGGTKSAGGTVRIDWAAEWEMS